MRIVSLHRSIIVLLGAFALISCGGSFSEDLQRDVDELEQATKDFEDAVGDFENASKLLECKLRAKNTIVEETCERLYGSSAGQSQRKSFGPSAGATLPPEPKAKVDMERLKENCSRYLELTDNLYVELNLLIGDSASKDKTVFSWPPPALIAYNTWSRFLGSSVQPIIDDLIASGLLDSSQIQPIRNIAFDVYSAKPAATKAYVTAFNNVLELPCKRVRTL